MPSDNPEPFVLTQLRSEFILYYAVVVQNEQPSFVYKIKD